jgi:OFA family oxalate/formate antiporter-like MFS transporter
MQMTNNRWVQLVAGIVVMVAIANFQYAFTLFVGPLQARHPWSRVQILDALNIFFISAQTWLVPLEGYLAERFGPRRLLFGGGILAGLSWVINAHAASLPVLYFAQVLGGTGSGIVYAISMGNALKWFPDRRGLAAGLTAAAFGAGSALTVLPISWMIRHPDHGYQAAFLWFGIGQSVVVLLGALVMRFPEAGSATAKGVVLQSRRDFAPSEMIRAPSFWLLYGMMTIGAIPGLLMLGQMAPMAEDFGIAEVPISLLGFASITAVNFALMLDRITGGLTRPVFGWISDRVGREPAIFAAFALEGAALLFLLLFAHVPGMFVAMSGLAFFGWGAIFSLFPAVNCDMFGRKFATTNYGWLYTAKGASTLLVAMLNRVHEDTGSWKPVFVAMIASDWLAALLALFVLKPLRARQALGNDEGRMAEDEEMTKAECRVTKTNVE